MIDYGHGQGLLLGYAQQVGEAEDDGGVHDPDEARSRRGGDGQAVYPHDKDRSGERDRVAHGHGQEIERQGLYRPQPQGIDHSPQEKAGLAQGL